MSAPERSDAIRIADALLAELGDFALSLSPARLANAVNELIDRGVIHAAAPPAAAAVVSTPLTPRAAMARAAGQLDAAAIAARSNVTAESALAAVAVAEGYRQLAATAASNVHLQPETEGN